MKKLLFLFLFFHVLAVQAQVTPDRMQKALMGDPSVTIPHLNDVKLVERFYQLNGYSIVWMNAEDEGMRNELFQLLASAQDYGLDEHDYQFDFIQSLKANQSFYTAQDTIISELQLTDAVLEFLSEIRNGNKPPELRYTGYKYQPDNLPLGMLLFQFINGHHLQGMAEAAEPTSVEYRSVKKLLLHMNAIMQDKNFKETRITSTVVVNTNKPLLEKLYQLGILDSIYAIDGKSLVRKLQQAQKMLNLLNDGKLRSTSMKELNIPLWARKEEVRLLLNDIRYLHGMRLAGSIAILNIPSATMYVYEGDSMTLESKIIVGKPSTPTPTLSSIIKEVIVYPYWHVPYKIATRELLPLIKDNIGYLEANDFQVLDKSGKVLNPYKINWQQLSITNFPYTIRQSTGCDNSLGLLKFNFYNPFTVYLHDTPGKGLFYLNKRYFSHGCMRVEKPVELSQILLKESAASINSLVSQCLKNQKPRTIQLDTPLPLIVLYSTAWYHNKGEIVFYEDVYLKRKLNRDAVAQK